MIPLSQIKLGKYDNFIHSENKYVWGQRKFYVLLGK